MNAIWINNVLGITNDKVLNHYNLEPADEIVKKIIPEAVYVDKKEKWTICFCPHEGTLEKDNFTYLIDNKWYDSIHTNDYKKLVEFFNKNKSKSKQTTIFDFLND